MPLDVDNQREPCPALPVTTEASSGIHLTHNAKPLSPNLLLPSCEIKDYSEFITDASAGRKKPSIRAGHWPEKQHRSTASLSPTTAGAMRNRGLAGASSFSASFSDHFGVPSNIRAPLYTDRLSDSLKVFPKFRPYFKHTHLITSSPLAYLAYYFLLNVGLTLQNKQILLGFPFPYTLSAIHALCSSIGSYFLVKNGTTVIPRLDTQEKTSLFAFSFLYTINIVISNLSLRLVTVPFHQIVRASVPFFTIVFSHIILGTSGSKERCVTLIPVVAGVAFATYGDYYFTPLGFFLTLLGTALAALKTIFTNVLQRPASHFRSLSDAAQIATPTPLFPRHIFTTKLPPLTPLQLLHLLSPLALAQSITIAYLSGELHHVGSYSKGFLLGLVARPPTPSLTGWQAMTIIFNGCVAFILNIASFNANKKIGALGMAVVGNIKQVLTILCAVCMFNLTITPMNALGIALTLFGGAWYGYVELREKQAKDRHLRFV